MNKTSEIWMMVWAGFGLLFAFGFVVCSLEYIADGKAEYLQRLAVISGIAFLLLSAATAIGLGLEKHVWRDGK